LSESATDADRELFDRVIHKPTKSPVLLSTIADLARVNPGRLAAPAGSSAPCSPLPDAGLRVLLADDNVVNQLVATRLLKRFRAQVHCVGNGVEVLQALAAANFDVVLMDCQMPEMDGFEATRQLRKSQDVRNPDIPVIALTANALATDREACLAAGMTDFLTKPIDRQRLQEALLRAVPERTRSSASALEGAR
jgi:CheY-like chemotaxis protein